MGTTQHLLLLGIFLSVWKGIESKRVPSPMRNYDKVSNTSKRLIPYETNYHNLQEFEEEYITREVEPGCPGTDI